MTKIIKNFFKKRKNGKEICISRFHRNQIIELSRLFLHFGLHFSIFDGFQPFKVKINESLKKDQKLEKIFFEVLKGFSLIFEQIEPVT